MAFHAQQCAEKYLKVLLSFRSIDFPRIYDLGELMELAGLRVDLTAEDVRTLTDYATVTRDPGDYEPVDLAGARRVRAAVRKALPRRATAARP